MNEWTYLGDGLYARFDGYQIELRANDTNDTECDTVYLERSTYLQLVRFAEREDVFAVNSDEYR